MLPLVPLRLPRHTTFVQHESEVFPSPIPVFLQEAPGLTNLPTNPNSHRSPPSFKIVAAVQNGGENGDIECEDLAVLANVRMCRVGANRLKPTVSPVPPDLDNAISQARSSCLVPNPQDCIFDIFLCKTVP